MKIFKKLLILFFIFFGIQSCGTVKEGFTNQKKKNVDEFLVEKKSPLVMPPNFNELPVPGSRIQNNNDSNEFKKLFNNSENKDLINKKEKNLGKSFEDSILEKIRK